MVSSSFAWRNTPGQLSKHKHNKYTQNKQAQQTSNNTTINTNTKNEKENKKTTKLVFSHFRWRKNFGTITKNKNQTQT